MTIYHDLYITILVWYNFLAYSGSTKVSRMCSMPVDSCVESCIYRMAQIFDGGGKYWRIWRISSNSSIFSLSKFSILTADEFVAIRLHSKKNYISEAPSLENHNIQSSPSHTTNYRLTTCLHYWSRGNPSMHVLRCDILQYARTYPAATQKGVADFQLQCTCILRFSHYVAIRYVHIAKIKRRAQ